MKEHFQIEKMSKKIYLDMKDIYRLFLMLQEYFWPFSEKTFIPNSVKKNKRRREFADIIEQKHFMKLEFKIMNYK